MRGSCGWRIDHLPALLGRFRAEDGTSSDVASRALSACGSFPQAASGPRRDRGGTFLAKEGAHKLPAKKAVAKGDPALGGERSSFTGLRSPMALDIQYTFLPNSIEAWTVTAGRLRRACVRRLTSEGA